MRNNIKVRIIVEHCESFRDLPGNWLYGGSLVVVGDFVRFPLASRESCGALSLLPSAAKPQNFSPYPRRIRQSIAPFFGEFQLAPSRLNTSKIRLQWLEHGSGRRHFDASSLSDGTLRFICLSVLLLQPDLPPLVLLDEPKTPVCIQPLLVCLLNMLVANAIIVGKHSPALLANQIF